MNLSLILHIQKAGMHYCGGSGIMLGHMGFTMEDEMLWISSRLHTHKQTNKQTEGPD